jgi:hypothetical protein
MNPHLGPLEDLGLSFEKLRVAAVGLKRGGLGWAGSELAALNRIRNKLAHRLDTQISTADVAPLGSVIQQWPIKAENEADRQKLLAEPAAVIEFWALFFGLMVAVVQGMEQFEDDLKTRQHALNERSAELLHELFGTTNIEGASDVAGGRSARSLRSLACLSLYARSLGGQERWRT